MSASVSSLQQEHFLRIHSLFQIAMPLLKARGFWQEIEGYPGKVRAFEGDDLLMLHRTPFQPVPISEAGREAGFSAVSQKEIARGYGLDVWWQRHKVMSLIWNDGGALGVIVYKEGEWQSYLEGLRPSA